MAISIEIITAGPAPYPVCSPTIATPTIVKIPEPITAPIPSIIRSKAFSVRFKFTLFAVSINSSGVFCFKRFLKKLFILFFTIFFNLSLFFVSVYKINNNA